MEFEFLFVCELGLGWHGLLRLLSSGGLGVLFRLVDRVDYVLDVGTDVFGYFLNRLYANLIFGRFALLLFEQSWLLVWVRLELLLVLLVRLLRLPLLLFLFGLLDLFLALGPFGFLLLLLLLLLAFSLGQPLLALLVVHLLASQVLLPPLFFLEPPHAERFFLALAGLLFEALAALLTLLLQKLLFGAGPSQAFCGLLRSQLPVLMRLLPGLFQLLEKPLFLLLLLLRFLRPHLHLHPRAFFFFLGLLLPKRLQLFNLLLPLLLGQPLLFLLLFQCATLFFLPLEHDLVQLLRSFSVRLIPCFLGLFLFHPLRFPLQLLLLNVCMGLSYLGLSLSLAWILHFGLSKLGGLSVVQRQPLIVLGFDVCMRGGLFVLLGEVVVGLARAPAVILLRARLIKVVPLRGRRQFLLRGPRFFGRVKDILLVEDRVTELALNRRSGQVSFYPVLNQRHFQDLVHCRSAARFHRQALLDQHLQLVRELGRDLLVLAPYNRHRQHRQRFGVERRF